MHSVMKALVGSYLGMSRGSWRPRIKWLGIVGRSVGAAPLPAGVPAYARWSQAFGPDGSPRRTFQDISEAKEIRGSLHHAQWRISAWGILVGGPGSLIPVGLFAQALFRAIAISNDSGPSFFASTLEASQRMADPKSLRGDENRGFALELCPGDSQQIGQLSGPHTQIGSQNEPPR